jgi:hypothetical protein
MAHPTTRTSPTSGNFSSLLVLATILTPVTSHAQAGGCLPTALVQRDMAGVWTAIDGPLQISINPCGGTLLQWRNEYGVSGTAAYAASSMLEGGGYTATVIYPDPVIGTPWSTGTVSYKPGVPGQIQIIFWVPAQGQFHLYNAIRTGVSA